jgi:hypothetical protein
MTIYFTNGSQKIVEDYTDFTFKDNYLFIMLGDASKRKFMYVPLYNVLYITRG